MTTPSYQQIAYHHTSINDMNIDGDRRFARTSISTYRHNVICLPHCDATRCAQRIASTSLPFPFSSPSPPSTTSRLCPFTVMVISAEARFAVDWPLSQVIRNLNE